MERQPTQRPAAMAAAGEQDADPVIRAKYIDYCSARLSDVFLALSDEDIYELMEEAAGEAELSAGALGFQAMVRLVTDKLQHSVPLPDFQTWAAEYRADPERYDPLLLGLWETALDPHSGKEW